MAWKRWSTGLEVMGTMTSGLGHITFEALLLTSLLGGQLALQKAIGTEKLVLLIHVPTL
jgi:hypothetical protein